MKIDLNADLGEGFGNYRTGNDEMLMEHITTASLAAGFHAGDPHVMSETVALAAEHETDIGVHPGLPDLMGFGRRMMDVSEDELQDYVTYQYGALQAFATQHDMQVSHVKPHGAMSHLLLESENHAHAFMEAVAGVDEGLICVVPIAPKTNDFNLYDVAHEHGLPAARIGLVDMTYDEDLNIDISGHTSDPEVVCERFLSQLEAGRVKTSNGTYVDVPEPDTFLVHGDNENIREILAILQDAMEERDIRLAGLTD